MLAYRGAAWDVGGAVAGSETATGVTVSENNSVLLGFWAANDSSVTFPAPSGMGATGASYTGTRVPNWAVFSQDVNAGATGSKVLNHNGGSPGSVLFSIKPS